MHRVVRRRAEAGGTVTLALRPDDAVPPERVATAAPGQFNMLWAFGIGEAPISVADHDGDLVLHTIRAAGAVTRALCAAEVGDVVGLRGPFGRGWGVDGAAGRDVLVVAGGLGLAPLRSLVTGLRERRHASGHISVLIGARTPGALLYPDLVAEWGRELDVAITVDAAGPQWRGEVGVVTKLVERAAIRPERTTAFLCGPEVMMRVVAAAAIERGVDPERIEVSLERNMHCAIGHCGHCQLGPLFLCRDGPVQTWTRVHPLLMVRSR